MLFVVGVDEDDGPRNGTGFNGSRQFLRASALIFGYEVDGVPCDSAFQFIAGKTA